MRGAPLRYTFTSVGVGNSVNKEYLGNISTNYVAVGGFSQLVAAIDTILRSVCTDVAIDKNSTATGAVTVGQNVTYQVTL